MALSRANPLLDIPASFWNVTYNAACYPGAPGLNGLSEGANCQHFAYSLLRHFGLSVPGFRSSNLWEDTTYTHHVDAFEPFDLLLWNSKPRAWGAHVGVYLGEEQVIHLAKSVGKPAVWSLSEFRLEPAYQHFIGAKRVQPQSENNATSTG
ncbi:MAG: NlpC/P60 family protein [Deinococcota bacterium]